MLQRILRYCEVAGAVAEDQYRRHTNLIHHADDLVRFQVFEGRAIGKAEGGDG